MSIATLEPPAPPAATAAEPLVAIVPICREPGDIAATIERYHAELVRLDPAVRFIAVLDGPLPRARTALGALRRAGWPLEVLALPQPMGEAAALAVGLGSAGAGRVLTLPAEILLEPADLQHLLAGLDRHDMMIAARGNGASVLGSGKLDRLLRLLFGVGFRDVRSPVRALRAGVAAELHPYGNQHRFLPLLAQAQGFTVGEIVARPAAASRRTSPLRADWSALMDVLTIWFLLRFLKKPFRFFGGFGFSLLALGGLITLWLITVRLVWGIPLADRPALVLSTLMIVLGLQIIAVGLIGEIIAFTYTRDLKDYRVERLVE
jgi:hypothetical protein